MTMHQLHMLKRWHVANKRDHPVEYHTFDAVLTVWLMGWIGTPAALLLDEPLMLLPCALGFLLPSLYVALRMRMHERRRLRCDWLDSIPAPFA